MVFPILPLYVQKLGGSDAVVGMVLGIFTFSTVLARPLTGYLLDRHRKKFILVGSLSVLPWLFFIRVDGQYRCSYGCADYSRFWMGICRDNDFDDCQRMIPKARFGEGMGYFSLANSLAMALAPASGIYIEMRYGDASVFLPLPFWGFGICCRFFLKCKSPEVVRPAVNGGLYEKEAIIPGVMLFLVAMAYGGVISFLPLFAAEKGIQNIGGFFVVYALSILLTRPLMGKMVDRWGFDYTVIPGFVCLLIALVLLADLRSSRMLMVVAVIYGTGFGAMITSLQTMAVRDVPRNRIGAANATLFTGNDLGIGLGVMLLGMVAEAWGYRDMYLFTAFPLLAALIFYVLFVRGHKLKLKEA